LLEKGAPVPVPELTCNKVHGVQAGETCSSVAQGSGLSQDDFLGFNPNINYEKMFIGHWVCLEATSARLSACMPGLICAAPLVPASRRR